MKETPELYLKKEQCCGCSACYAICPKNAITMIEDEEGFLYPQINIDRCVGCKMCLKVCPFK
jgi:formate hydrogenlyase subunit 6/NADH:ubiquinone oxidoreductase subunit I